MSIDIFIYASIDSAPFCNYAVHTKNISTIQIGHMQLPLCGERIKSKNKFEHKFDLILFKHGSIAFLFSPAVASSIFSQF